MPAGEDTILQGSLFGPLIRFTIPLMLSLLLQALYGAVDLAVVGFFGDTTSVSAVSNGGQVMQSVTEIIIGLSMGVTVLIGRYTGARCENKAAETVGGTIKLFLIAALCLTAAMEIFAGKIAGLMSVPQESLAKAVSYIRICSSGFVFITAFNVISSLFRGLGDSKSPLLFIAVACGANIAGDLLLCGVFRLDYAGAAIATVFSQALSVAFSIRKMRRGALPFRVGSEQMKNSSGAPLKILKIGGPVALQDFLVSVSFLVIIGIVNTLGLVASASIGISEKMFVFIALVPISFMYALSAFVAQNVGAKQEKRAVDAMKAAMKVAFGFGVVMAVLTYFFGGMLARIFVRDPAVIAATADYLRGTSPEQLIVPFVYCYLGYFNGIGKTHFVLAESLISSFGFMIPLCYLFSRLPNTNLYIIGCSVPIYSAACMLMCVGYFAYIRRKRLLT